MKDSPAPYFARPYSSCCSAQEGISQYAEIAARFHAALLSRDGGFSDMNSPTLAYTAFDHADAFFAELKKRQSSQ